MSAWPGEQQAKSDMYINERMRCPFGENHPLRFLAAMFGRFVTEWVRCLDCGRILEVQAGVIGLATLNAEGQIVPKVDPVAEKSWQRRQQRKRR